MGSRPSSSMPWRYPDSLPGRPVVAVAARALLWGTLLWGTLLTGCVGTGTPEEATAWHCSLTPDGANWKCKQQPATPAGDSVTTTKRQAGATTKPGSSSTSRDSTHPTAHQRTPSLEAPSWQRRLPGLQGQLEQEEVAMEPLSGAAPSGAQARQVPIPEPAMARWETAARPERMAPVRPEAARGSVEPDPTGGAPVPLAAAITPDHRLASSTPLVQQTNRYTVQIGAFHSVAAARAYIVQHGLEDQKLAVGPSRRNGRDYQVITFGEFDTVGEATAAWRQAEGNRGLEVWVRPIR